MNKVSLNQDWLFVNGTITMMELFTGGEEKIQHIDLPHDAMIYRDRTPDTANAHQTGFYPGGEYTYLKKWNIPESWRDKKIVLEFEGIADTCRIYCNGDLVAENYNPYTSVFVDVTRYLKWGQENELKAEVCSVERSSRWYSGAGLYRPVYAWVGGPAYIPAQGVHICTEEATSEIAAVEIEFPICSHTLFSGKIQAIISLVGPDGNTAAREQMSVTVYGEDTQRCYQRLVVEQPNLWSDEEPNLYTCKIELYEGEKILDCFSQPVGLRTIRINAKQGLMLNGKEVKLRGTCIHHDNGIIGAAAFPDAEYRRCRQMKEAGFNALRSSHHPMGKAMLDVCDRLGMLVLDELSDMWTRTKNQHDYANHFPIVWKQDVKNMVEKDWNHPCVIMYSTGNEIPEAGTARGAEWNRRINAEIKRLDPTRYTTSGINGLMAGTDRMMEIMCQASGMTPEELTAMQMADGAEQADADGQNQAGADEVNGMAAVIEGPLADAIATSPILEEMIGEFADATDVAGYNYLTALHEEDHRRHPNRVVLGTETFPADIVRLWDIVQHNHHVLGDFTWTGYDYLGEAGCGVFHYDGGVNFSAHWPDRLAGIGDIDILGDRKPISYLRQAVFGIGHDPAIGVMRMDKDWKNVVRTPWMWKDNVASWTWQGYEGQTASVDVYANADEIELFLNEESLGRKDLAGGYIAVYEIPYCPGKLEAVSYVNGAAVGNTMLQTAGEAVKLLAETSRTKLPADGESLAFVKIRLADQDGNINRQERKTVSVKTDGNVVLQGFGSADPSCEGSYQSDTWQTYDGTLMAVIKAGKTSGEAKVTFTADGCTPVTVKLQIGEHICHER
ncbi:MAG TPA: DUF4982 domain-containing protein [Candidatus Blautia faecipullorum]|nr:DUF4982 domain-containing protein [Candidatus Blautia faecipullorum]